VVFPGGDHRFCVRHLYANYRDSGHRGLVLKDKLWAAAAAYIEADFFTEMKELKNISVTPPKLALANLVESLTVRLVKPRMANRQLPL
jgi:hypothetical protein